ncbi:MAG: D-alanyl-D-alanine carboxypeptidase family protein [Acidimicrobiales bacterium]
MAFLTFSSFVASASIAQTSDELETIREERKQAQQEAAAQAALVDVQNAEVDELSAVLDALQANVNAQEVRVAEAQRKLDDANARFAVAIEAVNAKQAEIDALKAQLADRAISSFVGGEDTSSLIVETSDPNQAIRMQSLVDSVNRSEADLTESLKAAEEDLSIEQALADVAAQDAEAFATQRETELAELQVARDAQAAVTEAAEVRLDELLNRQAEIDARVDQLTAAEKAEKARLDEEARKLAEELATTAAAPKSSGGGGGGGGGGTVSAAEVVNACGINVHTSIQTATCNLINAAAADGVSLSGGGYRSNESQISLRRSHCGSSEYAIWSMPASQCRPPTARPGQSNHEKGLAIDFSNCNSRSTACYKWLASNASSYGFYNLPSEPWHWSVNGN